MRNLLMLILLIVSLMWFVRWIKSHARSLRHILESRPPLNPAERERYYLDVLGLKDHPRPEEIKRNYRELVAKYHPDKVQHLGVELQHTAHRKTREINAAYHYLSRKYRC